MKDAQDNGIIVSKFLVVAISELHPAFHTPPLGGEEEVWGGGGV